MCSIKKENQGPILFRVVVGERPLGGYTNFFNLIDYIQLSFDTHINYAAIS